MADLILYDDINFRGKHREITQSQQSLPDFDRITSSIIIRNGHWQFFTDTNFHGRLMGIGSPPSLGPGSYPWVEAVGITNDSIRSVKLVG
jgi:hypothetical protein